MDSTTDTPIILTEDYAQKCADAIVGVIVAHWDLTKKGSRTLTVAQPYDNGSITITAETANEIISATPIPHEKKSTDTLSWYLCFFLFCKKRIYHYETINRQINLDY